MISEAKLQLATPYGLEPGNRQHRHSEGQHGAVEVVVFTAITQPNMQCCENALLPPPVPPPMA